MTATFVLDTIRDRHFALDAVRRAPLGQQVVIGPKKRTSEQNAHLHAILNDIADQLGWPVDTGELHPLSWWKPRCTLGWLKERRLQKRGESPEVIESLDGDDAEVWFLLPHTSDLNVEEFSELIEWTYAFGAQNGVVFKEKPPPAEDQ